MTARACSASSARKREQPTARVSRTLSGRSRRRACKRTPGTNERNQRSASFSGCIKPPSSPLSDGAIDPITDSDYTCAMADEHELAPDMMSGVSPDPAPPTRQEVEDGLRLMLHHTVQARLAQA